MATIQILAPQPLTAGNNPWLDAISYNARWLPGSPEKTKLSIYFLSPKDIETVARIPEISRRLADDTSLGWKKSEPISTISGLQQRVILDAYKAWSKVCNIKARQAASPFKADIVFAAANYKDTASAASFSQVLASHQGLLAPSNGEVGYAVPKPSSLPLIAEFNSKYFNEVNQDENLFRFTILHEIGHGLGLSHPHDQGLGSVVKPIFPGTSLNDSSASFGEGIFGMNNINRTIMSYSTGYGQSGVEQSGRALPNTPMALDVMAAQLKYGYRASSNAEDNVYKLKGQIGLEPKWSCIYDTGGNDKISARSIEEGITISLIPAYMTSFDVEESKWGDWDRWSTVLDLITALTARVPGTIYSQSANFDLGLVRYMDAMAQDKHTRADLISRLNYMRKLIGTADLGDMSMAIRNMYLLSSATGLEGFSNYLERSKPGLATAEGVEPVRVREFAAAAIGFIDYVSQYLGAIPEEYALSQIGNQFIAKLMEHGLQYVGGSFSGVTTDPLRQPIYGRADWIDAVTSWNVESSVELGKGGYSIAAGTHIEAAEGGMGNDRLIAFFGSQLKGLGGRDILQGFAFDDMLFGGRGGDQLFGHAGGDFLMGNSGNDYLYPQLGLEAVLAESDACDGGKGQDVVVLDGLMSDYSVSPATTSDASYEIRSLLHDWSTSVVNVENIIFTRDSQPMRSLASLVI